MTFRVISLTEAPADFRERQLQDCMEKVEVALSIAASAEKSYRRDPSRINRINLLAASRLLKETRAEMEEWKQ
jgi:hypothetical protein